MKVLHKNGEITTSNFDEREGKKAFWHTSAHVLAQAVKHLYPDTKCAIGPATDNGFYYDFAFSFPFSEENMLAVEEEMKRIVRDSLSLQVRAVSRKEALSFMENAKEDFKLELIHELPDAEELTFYRQGDYTELCAGPHLTNTSPIKAIKLLSVAGAYWRGDENNQMLTRIYGISFPAQPNCRNIFTDWRKPKPGITAGLERNWDCLPCWTRDRDFPFAAQRADYQKSID